MPGVLARLGARARVGDEERAAETGRLVDVHGSSACGVLPLRFFFREGILLGNDHWLVPGNAVVDY